MRSISDTIARLVPHPATPAQDRLTDFAEPFDNPGALRALTYVPADLPLHAPLVVVLHGCTQTAGGYDHGSGWSEVADAHGFALLFPEQVRANNPNRCFNWFLRGDTSRGQGEVSSIRAMIAAVVAAHALDPSHVFVTGLSAGGAMTAAMLATYPEVFAAGAIIAGLPYGVAGSVPEALERMQGRGLPDAGALARKVRDAAPGAKSWPPVSVWHGDADATVVPATGEAVVAQWLAVHGLDGRPPVADRVDGHPHRTWHDDSGRVAVESHIIAGMGHGTPLDTADCGTGGAFMLDVGISSTLRMAERWGLLRTDVQRALRPETEAQPRRATAPKPETPVPSKLGVGRVIDDALRAAGLVR